jgi:hypothetical protein
VASFGRLATKAVRGISHSTTPQVQAPVYRHTRHFGPEVAYFRVFCTVLYRSGAVTLHSAPPPPPTKRLSCLSSCQPINSLDQLLSGIDRLHLSSWPCVDCLRTPTVLSSSATSKRPRPNPATTFDVGIHQHLCAYPATSSYSSASIHCPFHVLSPLRQRCLA